MAAVRSDYSSDIAMTESLLIYRRRRWRQSGYRAYSRERQVILLTSVRFPISLPVLFIAHLLYSTRLGSTVVLGGLLYLGLA